MACGADMKAAFALARGDTAYLFDGFGYLSDLDNYTRYEKAVREALDKLKIRPKIVVCDLHPGYFSTHFAEEFSRITNHESRITIQHHEAHIASAIVDNGIKGEVLGVAFDGTGYGSDGNIWGGEFFVGGLKNLKRVAHLDYIPMPGGEACIREPWRIAASYLYIAFGESFLKLKIDFVRDIDKKRWAVIKGMIDKRINSPLTSSMGRLFDAVGSIILGKTEAKFEAELPIELERIAEAKAVDYYNFDKTVNIIKGVVKDLKSEVAPSVISARFHNTIAHLILKTAKRYKMKGVALSGGVFQNKFLLNRVIVLLAKNSFKVYTHSEIPTNDSGIPIGQVAIANARRRA